MAIILALLTASALAGVCADAGNDAASMVQTKMTTVHEVHHLKAGQPMLPHDGNTAVSEADIDGMIEAQEEDGMIEEEEEASASKSMLTDDGIDGEIDGMLEEEQQEKINLDEEGDELVEEMIAVGAEAVASGASNQDAARVAARATAKAWKDIAAKAGQTDEEAALSAKGLLERVMASFTESAGSALPVGNDAEVDDEATKRIGQPE